MLNLILIIIDSRNLRTELRKVSVSYIVVLRIKSERSIDLESKKIG